MEIEHKVGEDILLVCDAFRDEDSFDHEFGNRLISSVEIKNFKILVFVEEQGIDMTKAFEQYHIYEFTKLKAIMAKQAAQELKWWAA